MQNNTAVLPTKYNFQALKNTDPRFYSGKDVVIVMARKENSYIPPENAFIIPLIKRAEIVTLRSGQGKQIIYPAEKTSPTFRVSGKV